MGPWWTRDGSGRLEALDEAWLSARVHQAAMRAGMHHPHWPLWQSELVSSAAHCISQSLSPGEVVPKVDLVDRLATVLDQLGQPQLASGFREVCREEWIDQARSGPDGGTIGRLLGPDIQELMGQGWLRPILPGGAVDFSGPYKVPQARFYLPGCPDPARALVRLIQTASWCWGEIHLVGSALWLEELGAGPGRGLEAFDLLEEAAQGLGKRLRLHLPMGPGAAPHPGQMGLFLFGGSQGLREPSMALQRWLGESGQRVSITGWMPPTDSASSRESSQAMACLAELARPGRSVRVLRSAQSPDLLALWGAGRKSVEAILGGLVIPWEAVSGSNLPETALDQLVALAVRAGGRFRHALRQAGKSLWVGDPAALWRMAWLIRCEGNWPKEVLDRLSRLAMQLAHAAELPLFWESETEETANLLDARQWRSAKRLVPHGDGPWTLHVEASDEPDLPGIK